ncbi:hypothetical protein ASPFODRAFT_54096 [Aspergillus luchuensis CBS 106.47]|uniref:Uncharacterized protein n=1 Tax=Aspergillus luchuensis (strain CBS 106.47) TaxID=1137211 RepID=A0A1M3T013_ASPLC|nr:hypothetical protein ASPFODRAFT_54096 [Aspergillus luchuensis CBS 106.47]
MAWIIRCPDLFRGFLIACIAEVLSQRIVAVSSSGVVVAAGLRLAILRARLIAKKMPTSSAAWTDQFVMEPMETCRVSATVCSLSRITAAAPRMPFFPDASV